MELFNNTFALVALWVLFMAVLFAGIKLGIIYARSGRKKEGVYCDMESLFDIVTNQDVTDEYLTRLCATGNVAGNAQWTRLGQLAANIHHNNKQKGFYDEQRNIGEILALIHSEVSEMLEADRKGREWIITDDKGASYAAHILQMTSDDHFKALFERLIKDSPADELADTTIRCLDLAAYKGVDIEAHILAKMRYNSLREHKHGKRY